MKKVISQIISVLDHVLNGIIILISTVIILISGYSLYDNAQIHRNASDPSLLTYKPVMEGSGKGKGSVYLDSNNAPDLSDEYSMIYGHHMDHYDMFGSLDLFASEAYFDAHREGWIQTREKRYGLELFAVVWGDASDRIVFYPEGRTAAEVAVYINDNAVINTGYEPGRRIVALSTCSGEKMSSRLIVFGMLNDS